MKHLRYMRHSYYDKKTGFIPQGDLDNIKGEGKKHFYTDIFYGPIYRTLQTALAVVAGIWNKCRVHEVIPKIGNVKRLERCKEILEYDLDKEALEKYSFFALETLFEMFSRMEGNTGLAVGHAYGIELAALVVGGKKIPPLPYLGFVDFVQDDDGKITMEN